MKLLDKFAEIELSQDEYNDIAAELELFKSFLLASDRGDYSVRKIDIDPLFIYDKKRNIYTHVTYNIAKFKVDSLFIRHTIADFGCFLVSEGCVYFPMPVYVDENGDVFIWNVAYGIVTNGDEYNIMVSLSEMFRMRVQQADLITEMSAFFERKYLEFVFGVVDSEYNYFDVIQEVLKGKYNVAVKKVKVNAYIAFIRTIYDLWDKLLTSKGVLNLEPVKKMWGVTKYEKDINTWRARRVFEDIGLYIPFLLTYANLYEKGIESDFGKAILKNLKDKKELESLERTLLPMARYIIRSEGLPYEISKVISLQIINDIIEASIYRRIYQSVLNDIFRKLKAVG